METKTADEIINMIAETLSEADDDFIKKIANMVLSGIVKCQDGKFVIYEH